MRRALRVKWLFILLVGLLGVTLYPTVTQAAESAAEHGHYSFNPEGYMEHSYTYGMTTTGSIDLPGLEDDQGNAIKLSADVRLTLDPPNSTNEYPISVHILEASSEGFPVDLGRVLAGTTLRGALDDRGRIVHIETPESLSNMGLDGMDLFWGLFVPKAAASDSAQDSWEANIIRDNLGPQRTRIMRLQATYTRQGVKAWSGRPLEAVSARLRGSTSFRDGTSRTEIQEIAHALFYVEPLSGVTQISSVSKVTSVDIIEPNKETLRLRNSLTTTLEIKTPSSSAAAPTEHPVSTETSSEPSTIEDPDREETPLEAEVPLDERPPSDEKMAPSGDTPQRAEPTSNEHSPQSTWAYRDPAERFHLKLPAMWEAAEAHLSLRSTTLTLDEPLRHLYVYVVPLPSPGASSQTVARSALTTYQETQNGFSLLQDASPTQLDGESAYKAHYRYQSTDGATFREWGLFTRHEDRAYYLQYAAPVETDPTHLDSELKQIADLFRFGSTPRGLVSPDQLEGSLHPYTDPTGSYSLLVPSLWPMVDHSHEAGTTSFTEIGESGYLNLFAQSGATGYSAQEIIASWKEQWAQESGFQLVTDVSARSLSGRDGAELVYRWRPDQEREWTRRLQATVIDDTFYAVALDYVSSGYEQRSHTFDRIFSSFRVMDETEESNEPASENVDRQETQGTPDQQEPHEDQAPQVTQGASHVPVADPVAEDRALLLGRFLLRYPGQDGQTIEEWANQVTVFISIVGADTFREVTDDEGFVFIPNLPRVSQDDVYRVTRIEGRLFGFDQDVAVTFENLTQGVSEEGVANLGTVILTLDESRAITVEIERGLSGVTGRPSPLERFLSQFPSSAWTEHVRALILRGTE